MLELSGKQVAGFQVGPVLAQGGFARVYEASGPDGQRAVVKVGLDRGGSGGSTRTIQHCPAMALVLGSVTTDMRTVGRVEVDAALEVEVDLLRSDGGRLLPRLLDVAQVEDRPALVLERLEGPSLAQRLAGGEAFTPDDALRLLDALVLAGQEGRLAWHGDLKPEHVYLEQTGVRLLDPAYRARTPGFYLATPEYNPLLAAGPQADVIAVAAMLFQSQRGQPPFRVAPPAFALQLQPDAEREQRLRLDYRYSVDRLEGAEGVPVGLARFVDETVDAILLDPRGGKVPDCAAAAAFLRECLAD